MTVGRRLTTKRQALRAFRELLAACDMSSQEYIEVLRTFGELAQEYADDEMIVQRIYAIQSVRESQRQYCGFL